MTDLPTLRLLGLIAELSDRIDGLAGQVDHLKLDGVGALLQRAAMSFGVPVSPARLWRALLAAGSRAANYTVPNISDGGSRRRLERICRELNGVSSLVLDIAEQKVPPIVVRAALGEMVAADYVTLQELRDGLRNVEVPHWVIADDPQHVGALPPHPSLRG
jgi:hypothetical protein